MPLAPYVPYYLDMMSIVILLYWSFCFDKDMTLDKAENLILGMGHRTDSKPQV